MSVESDNEIARFIVCPATGDKQANHSIVRLRDGSHMCKACYMTVKSIVRLATTER